jgi:hypothetical protein
MLWAKLDPRENSAFSLVALERPYQARDPHVLTSYDGHLNYYSLTIPFIPIGVASLLINILPLILGIVLL